MSLQGRVAELAEAELTFLPGECDKFLLGYAVQGGTNAVRACYGYQAAKAAMLDRYRDSKRAYAELNYLMTDKDAGSVLWLYRYSRKVLWEIINRAQYKRWASLDKAVLGVGHLAGDPVGVVYNRALCVDILTMDTVSSDPSATALDAINFVDDNVVGVYLQEYTPWFLTHVK